MQFEYLQHRNQAAYVDAPPRGSRFSTLNVAMQLCIAADTTAAMAARWYPPSASALLLGNSCTTCPQQHMACLLHAAVRPNSLVGTGIGVWRTWCHCGLGVAVHFTLGGHHHHDCHASFVGRC
jgi:hypothetical protein